MIFPGPQSGFTATAEALHDRVPGYAVNEVMSFNMRAPDDGARVRVLTDSTLIVTLNQRGPWVQGYDPARSYETQAYHAEILDSQRYQLTLREPESELWFQAGGQLKTVDLQRRDAEQR
jgi:hypothetical protein